jgi:hypothetical protein
METPGLEVDRHPALAERLVGELARVAAVDPP